MQIKVHIAYDSVDKHEISTEQNLSLAWKLDARFTKKLWSVELSRFFEFTQQIRLTSKNYI